MFCIPYHSFLFPIIDLFRDGQSNIRIAFKRRHLPAAMARPVIGRKPREYIL